MDKNITTEQQSRGTSWNSIDDNKNGPSPVIIQTNFNFYRDLYTLWFI